MDHSSDKFAADETMNNAPNNNPTNPTRPENRTSSTPPHASASIDRPESSTRSNFDDQLLLNWTGNDPTIQQLFNTHIYMSIMADYNHNYDYNIIASFGNNFNPPVTTEHMDLADQKDPGERVDLREWLESEGPSTSKADRIDLFRQVVKLVDHAHRRGAGLLDLMPSSFELTADRDDVKYVGRLLHNDHSVSAAEKGRMVIDAKKNVAEREKEKEWYAFPVGFDYSNLASFNVYCLGILLFEFMNHFERIEERNLAMVNLHQWILPPCFLTGSDKEAEVCLWLLHPEPSSRPTTREILKHELLYDIKSTDSSTYEDSSDGTDNDVDAAAAAADNDDDGGGGEAAETDLLLDFLNSLEKVKQNEVLKIRENVEILDSDIELVKKAYALINSSDTKNPNVLENKLLDHMNQLESAYFSMRASMQCSGTDKAGRTDTDVLGNRERVPWAPDQSDPTKPATRLEMLFDGICKLARVSKFELCGLLKNGEMLNSNKVICSLCFDRDEDYIASAGVEKQIKVFEIGSFLDGDVDIQYPSLEMSNESKISCISWNSYIRSHLVSSDFDGLVQMWDVNSGQRFTRHKEHQNRVWSVDFSRVDPMKFASGGDDCSVRLWSANEKNSVGVIWNRATVCCVQFSAYSSNLLAFGSVDHNIYLYDLRHTRIPWCTLAGHGHTVSYVRFLDSETVVSASLDNTLKLWDLNKTNLQGLSTNACDLTFSGHTNERNFVGMAVCDGYIATGSETNEVYTYYKSLPMPIVTHKLECFDTMQGDDAANGVEHFVSSVCWRTKSQMLVAANSGGHINVLRMV